MRMTPLHVLCCNPNATLEMIRVLCSTYPEGTVDISLEPYDMYPLEMYLRTNIHSKRYEYHNNVIPRMAQYLSTKVYDSTDCNIHDIIKSGLDHDLVEILYAFMGSSIGVELAKPDNVTGLYPFMTAAASNNQQLDFVYKIAIENPSVFERDTIMVKKGRKRYRRST